jgi:hypothetical protein
VGSILEILPKLFRVKTSTCMQKCEKKWKFYVSEYIPTNLWHCEVSRVLRPLSIARLQSISPGTITPQHVCRRLCSLESFAAPELYLSNALRSIALYVAWRGSTRIPVLYLHPKARSLLFALHQKWHSYLVQRSSHGLTEDGPINRDIVMLI